jgi:hypothetical protein
MKIINYLIAIALALPYLGSCSAMEMASSLVDITFVNNTGNEIQIETAYKNGKNERPALVLAAGKCSLKNQNLNEVTAYKVSFRFMPTSDFGSSMAEFLPKLRSYKSQTINADLLGQKAAQEGCHGLQVTLVAKSFTGFLSGHKYSTPTLKSPLSGLNYGTLFFGFGKPQIISTLSKDSENKNKEEGAITKLEGSLLEDSICGLLAESIYFMDPSIDDKKEQQEIQKAVGCNFDNPTFDIFGLGEPPDPTSVDTSKPLAEQNQEVQRYIMRLQTAYEKLMKKSEPDETRDVQMYQEKGIKDFSRKVQHYIHSEYCFLLKYLQVK